MSWNGKQSKTQKIQWRKVNLVSPLASPYTFEQQVSRTGLTSATTPTDRLVQYLNEQTFQVHGAIQAAQSSVIQSPEVQDVQLYTIVESKHSQELADSVTDLQEQRDILSRRPSYRKILNYLLSDMPAVPRIKEEKMQEDSCVVTDAPTTTAVNVPTQVYDDSSSQYNANTQEEALQSNSINWVQGIKTLTMTKIEAVAQPRGIIQDVQTSDPIRNRLVVQTASGEVQAFQSQAVPTSSISPGKIKDSAPVLPTQGATEKVTRKRKIYVKNSERPQTDTLIERAKKPKSNDQVVDPRPPPAKLAQIKQKKAIPQGQDRSKKKSSVANEQDESLHSTGSLLPVFCVVEHSQNQLEGDRKLHAEFVLVKKDLLFNQLIEMALLALGYSHSSATQAKGLIQVGRWNPVPLSCVTDASDATVADMLQDIHHVITLRIQLHSSPKLEDLPPEQWTHFTVRKALRNLLKDMSQSSLAQKCPLSQSMISAIKNSACYSNVSAAKCHEFAQWYRLFKRNECMKKIDSFPEKPAHMTLNQQPITGSLPEQSSSILFSQRVCIPSPSSLYPPRLVTQPLSSQIDNQQPVMSQVLNQQYTVSCMLACQGFSPSSQQYLNYPPMTPPAKVFSKAPDFQAPQQAQCRIGGGPVACAQNQTMAGFSEQNCYAPNANSQCVREELKSAGISQAISSLVAFNSNQNVFSEVAHMEEAQKHPYRQAKLEAERDHIYQEQEISLIGFNPSCSNITPRSTEAGLSSVGAVRGLRTERSFNISSSIYEEIQNEITRANVSQTVFAKVAAGKSQAWLRELLHCKEDPSPENQTHWVDLCMIHFFLRLSQSQRDYIYEQERI